MSSPLKISEPIASTQVEANNQENEHEEPVVGRKREKTSVVWNDFDEMEISPGWRKLVLREAVYGFFQAVWGGLAGVVVGHGENRGSRKRNGQTKLLGH